MRALAFLVVATVLVGNVVAQKVQRVPSNRSEQSAQGPTPRGTSGVPFRISGGSSALNLHDGVLVGVGDDYKAIFNEGGMQFTPALGTGVPDNQPLRVTLETIRRGQTLIHRAATASAAEPSHSGKHALYKRGAITERYEVRPEAVKQSFVFPAKPEGNGDLVVRLRMGTPMEARAGMHLDRVEARAGDVGGVDIETVLGIDADGLTAAGYMNFDGAHLELVLPEAFVESATYPMVLDPYYTTFFVYGSPGAGYRPDVAYAERTRTYLAVWHIVYSTSDYDILGQRVDWCGQKLGGLITIETSTANEQSPSVSYVVTRGRFVVTYERGPVGNRDIAARSVTDDSGSVGARALIANTPADEFQPAVGGEIGRYNIEALIVWADSSTGIRWAEYHIWPNGDLTYIRELLVHNNPGARNPTICKTGGAQRRFVVAWEEGNGNYIGVRFVDADSNPLSATGFIGATGLNPIQPCVDGDGVNFVMSYTVKEPSNNWDVWFIDLIIPPNPTLVPQYSSQVPIAATPNVNEYESSIAYLGGAVGPSLVQHAKDTGSGHDMWSSARRPNGTLYGTRSNIGHLGFDNRNPAIASRRSGGSSATGALIAWESSDYIYGRIYNESAPGSFQTFQTGCNGLGLEPRGIPYIGESVGFGLRNNVARPLLWFGLSQVNVPLCSGCTLGTTMDVILNLGVVPSTPLSLIPCDPGFVGAQMYIQGANLVSGGCRSPIDFTLSDTVKMTIGG